MEARTAVAKYLNQTWTEEERNEIEDYGQDLAAQMYGKLILSDSETGEMPEPDTLRDLVYGPETAEGHMVLEAMKEEAGIRDDPEVIRETAEWAYLSQHFEDPGTMGSTKFHFYDEDTRIQLISRKSTDGSRTEEGRKTVEIGLSEIPIDDLDRLAELDYEFEVGIDSPDTVPVQIEGKSLEQVQEEAVEQARKQTEASGNLSYRGEFDGGWIEFGGTRDRIILNSYWLDKSAEADLALELAGL